MTTLVGKKVQKNYLLCVKGNEIRETRSTLGVYGEKEPVVRFVHRKVLNLVYIVSVSCVKYFCVVIKTRIALMNFSRLKSILFYKSCMNGYLM